MGATCCNPETPTANLGPHNPYANISLTVPTSADNPPGSGITPPLNPYLQQKTYEKLQLEHNLVDSRHIDPGMGPTMPFIVSPTPHYSNRTQMRSSVVTRNLESSPRIDMQNNSNTSYSVDGVSQRQSSQYVAANSSHQPSPAMAVRVQLPKPTPEIQTRRKMLGVLKYQGDDRGVQLQPYRYVDSSIIYFGQWLNGKPHGRGIIYFPDGSVFQGGFKQGKTVGTGRLINSNGHYYQGFVSGNAANGYGVSENNTTRFQGQFMNNVPHGKGTQFSLDGKSRFVGTLSQGNKLEGVLTWGDNNEYTYQGSFKNNLFEGQGTLTSPSGFYNGEFRQGKKYGRGEYRWTDGRRYEGSYQNDVKSSYGQLFNSDGSLSYKGNWASDLPNGVGTTNLNGREVTATWKNGTYLGPA